MSAPLRLGKVTDKLLTDKGLLRYRMVIQPAHTVVFHHETCATPHCANKSIICRSLQSIIKMEHANQGFVPF